MQVRIFNVRIFESEDELEELNRFLRGHHILEVTQELMQNGTYSYWCYSIRYNEKQAKSRYSKEKVDYKNVLDEDKFRIFSKLREIRKEIAKNDAVPAFAVFTDDELSKVALLDEINIKNMNTVEGIGEKKIEKYGEKLLELYEKAAKEKDKPEKE